MANKQHQTQLNTQSNFDFFLFDIAFNNQIPKLHN